MPGCRFRTVVFVAILFVSGCHLRAPYTRPNVRLPSTYAHADEAARATLDHWWERFGDTDLNALVAQALDLNNDLALAALNVRAAQLQMHLAVINPLLAAGYTHDYARPLTSGRPATQFHSLTASVSYEVDLWGQLGALKDAARWEARATVEDRQSAALALIGATVNLYYQIAALNQRVTLGEDSVAYAQKTLNLVHVLAAAGGATRLEIAQAEQSLEAQKAAQTELIEQRVENRNGLRVLLNGAAWSESRERPAVPEGPPPSVAADLPASLLDRRPDLRAADLRLREALAQTDATRLSFYPNLTLTGSLGAASAALSQVVQNPIGSLAVVLAAPFVQFNQAKFSTELARTEYDKAVVSFRKTLLQALTDVDDALSARTQLSLQAANLERSVDAAKTTEHINEVRYLAGAVQLRTWLDAQEARRQAEMVLSLNRLARLQNFATLCLSLGGGADRL